MNKELINKYKHEFDHWLNGGSTLLGIRNLVSSTIRWYPSISDPFEEESTSGELLVIINDEYVEFRKALAEGKVIEYLGQSSNLWHEVPEPDFNLHPTCYRIKPDEPKFKVGDFVRVAPKSNRAITNSGTTEFTGIIRVIDKYNLYNIRGIDGTDWFESDDIQPWTPIKGEWCWFYDNPNKDKYCNLSQFNEMYNNYFMSITNTPWKCCEPFLNSIPSYLKDK